MRKTDPHTLSGNLLEFSFLQSCGVALLGKAEGPFAIHSTRHNSLLLFGATESNYAKTSFEDGHALYPFDVALEHSASFFVNDGVVTCVMGKSTCTGSTYSEAAMRALIAMKQVEDV